MEGLRRIPKGFRRAAQGSRTLGLPVNFGRTPKVSRSRLGSPKTVMRSATPLGLWIFGNIIPGFKNPGLTYSTPLGLPMLHVFGGLDHSVVRQGLRSGESAANHRKK